MFFFSAFRKLLRLQLWLGMFGPVSWKERCSLLCGRRSCISSMYLHERREGPTATFLLLLYQLSISCFAFNYLDFLLFWSHPCLTNALLDLSLQLKKAYLGPFLCFFSFLILIHWPPRYSEISAAKVDRHQSSWFCSIALVS